MSIDSKQLRNLSRIYQEAVYGGGKKETPKDTRMVVTAADKKANTKAYQNYKAGNKAYKAADHMKEQKKAAKDYDGDGKVESGKEEYFGSRDKAIKKAMGKKVKESFSNWRHDLKEIPNYDQIPVSGKARNEKISEKNVKNSIKINPEMKEEYGKKKKKKGHHCASKVKHEEFGVGRCIPEAHDLDEYGNVAHYDVEFEEYIVEGVPVEQLEIIEGMYHEHVVHEAATTRVPAENGNVYELMYSWRGRSYFCKMFFPQPNKPSKDEVQAALTKVYPSSILRNFYISSVNYGDPYIHAGKGDGFTDK